MSIGATTISFSRSCTRSPPRIHVGDPVNVRLMGASRVLQGHVESIETGIEDRDRGEGSNLPANVNPTFNWVRLAQRVPVRVALEHTPVNGDLVAGRTATVEVLGRKEGSFHLASALESVKEPGDSRKASSP